jgi:hypothetical protein
VLSRLGQVATVADAAEGPAARFQLFERIGPQLRGSATGAPRLVVIDDLHRADEASLRLLAYLEITEFTNLSFAANDTESWS